MPLRYGQQEFAAFNLGSTSIVRIFLGGERVWPDGAAGIFAFTASAASSATFAGRGQAVFTFSASAETRVRARPLFAFTASASGSQTFVGEAGASFAFTATARSGNAFSDGFNKGFEGGVTRQASLSSSSLFALSATATATRRISAAASATMAFTASANPAQGGFGPGFDEGFS